MGLFGQTKSKDPKEQVGSKIYLLPCLCFPEDVLFTLIILNTIEQLIYKAVFTRYKNGHIKFAKKVIN